MQYTQPSFAWHAPAKLNLFLHITGRRNDGYHLLQTIFHFLDFGDKLYFEVLPNSTINLAPALENVSNEENIIVKAAKLLQNDTGCTLGANITLDKQLPMGGGLGGGSSDAATTLLALNKLWKTGLNKKKLMNLGLGLGADVPVFINGHAAWAEGVGEALTNISLDDCWYLVLFPNININTGTIFSSGELTRNKVPIKIRDFLNGSTENVCQAVVSAQYPEVKEALNWLSQFSEARLTGTGACVFASFESEHAAKHVARQVPERWQAFAAKGLNETHIETFYWGVAKR
ncbi:MAG TPA: 4-(cytidine 5'-diphospho)-2-C-methyl-D-erythritol kinase [Gammaproteobacteria bacterium]|nr:4-(cytidine 5'-diphospho)-2-C-methyl-D-erythritol kinase [Gammaproteobacteria bacterium]